MAAITNGSGKNRKAGNAVQAASIDDDQRQVPTMVVAFTSQAMIVANAAGSVGSSTPSNMIV